MREPLLRSSGIAFAIAVAIGAVARADAAHAEDTVPYEVRNGESLYVIAERLLDDPSIDFVVISAVPRNRAELAIAAMRRGKDVMADMAKNNSDPASKAMMELFFHPYPWHAAACGDMDLTGLRKPQSYYRDIIWNRGDRVYATVRLPETGDKKIIAIMWADYPTLPSWTWPGEEGKPLEVEVYSGAEKVRLYLNDKLIGEKPTGREQEFKAVFPVPYAPGVLKAEGLRGDRVVAESVLRTSGKATRLRVAADRATIASDGEDLSFVTVEAVDADGRPDLSGDQEVQIEISGPGTIAAVGNGDGKDPDSYHGDRRKLYQGRALAVIRSSRQAGRIRLTARSVGLREGSLTINSKAATGEAELKRWRCERTAHRVLGNASGHRKSLCGCDFEYARCRAGESFQQMERMGRWPA